EKRDFRDISRPSPLNPRSSSLAWRTCATRLASPKDTLIPSPFPAKLRDSPQQPARFWKEPAVPTLEAPTMSSETADLFQRYVVPNYRRYPVSLVRGEGS